MVCIDAGVPNANCHLPLTNMKPIGYESQDTDSMRAFVQDQVALTDSSEFGAVSLSDVTDRLTGPTLFDVVACKSMSFTSTANRLGSVLAVAFCYSLSHSRIAACSPPTRQSFV